MSEQLDMTENPLEKAGGPWFILTAILLMGYLISLFYNTPSCLYQLLAYLIAAAAIVYTSLSGIRRYANQRIESYEMIIQQKAKQEQVAKASAASRLREIKILQDDQIINASEYAAWKNSILREVGVMVPRENAPDTAPSTTGTDGSSRTT